MTIYFPAGYCEFIVGFSLTGSTHTMSTSIGLGQDGTVTFTDMLTDLTTAWMDHLSGGSLSSAWTVTQTELRDATNIVQQPVGTAGTSGDDVVTPNVCVLVKKVTPQRGRANRGRMFLPAGYLPEGEVDELGNISDAELGDIQTNITAWSTAVGGVAGITGACVLHSTEALGAPAGISALTVERMVATQRRRLR